MKITCPKCTKAYRLNDDLVYQICHEKILCTECGHSISVEPQILNEEELHTFSSGEALKQEVVNNLKKLYPMPHILFKAKAMLSGRENFKELEHLFNTDPALAGRVLKIANSAYYGLSGKVSSIQMAATVLGSKTLLQIITLIGHSKMLGRSLPGYGLDSGLLWKHSLAVAICSRLIEETLHAQDGDDAFLAGLMHDAGKIILDTYVLERQPLFRRYVDLTRSSMTVSEKKILEFTHADIGSALCRKWNLPETMATAIQYHHTPAASGSNRLAYILNLADHMAKEIDAPQKAASKPSQDALRFLPITEIGLRDLTRKASEALESLEEDTY
ncbi:HDOD domain-containing protein [Desulfoluna sp.]|uniref:HDOD domain-containing protein n=1 Tax=Desulfoluna sp. TaxID=2045199 RepID=UPI002635598A|nr:HDOD domain-containing protein [Desulfoluna sp.]